MMNDAGLQPERTILAWRRTQILLALVICTAFRCLHSHPLLTVAFVVVAASLVLLIIVEQPRSYRRGLLGIAGYIPTCNPRAVLVLSLCSALLAAIALLSVLIKA